MVASQNGYRANDRSLVSSRLVPGTTRKLTVRNGAPGDLLLWVASQFDKLVEDIEQGILDDWGYAERPIRGSTTVLSNHASGTAIDLNATAHPLATEPTANFSKEEIATIRAVIARTEGCVRWGGDYSGRKDGMHFEIADGVSEERCAQVLAKLIRSTGGGGGAPATAKRLNGDEPAMIFTYDNTFEVTGYEQNTDAAGKVTLKPIRELRTKVIPLVLPVGATSAMVAEAWVSVKCAGGGAKIEYVRLMSIRTQADRKMPGGGYPVDKEFTDIDADTERVSIKAADGQDQFTVMVRSAAPFSICVEMKSK